MLTLFVIKNCDTCRKARKALDEKGLPYQVHDLREDGLSAALLEHILARVPVMEALNRRSTTWRNLPEEDKKEIDANKARALIMANPTLLKRPLLDTGDDIILGYRDGDYDTLKG
ncbi:Spx/MgsR family RNA polymerase-binding regulatory protein [Halomonas sp. M5N1S17]|uniref:Spx/MgsR family RNA polymerase-binding regulatory protein n=1 Tax=Halomonas alkalisoli TaxID=2907158 RepID=UPI001F288512|nr:Spx/MgsR family RNA polymerase-binding regulatory protein [Halomonas alkalisoli]MCE9664135.1 Spx/MgsR family RNA polymerase-binding regulatory protein [Halomonas alkalisoli]MCE9681383.1 Spx/MgsR family RNA polymerase-binding regulatory protein [Halomonas alkalisoli]